MQRVALVGFLSLLLCIPVVVAQSGGLTYLPLVIKAEATPQPTVEPTPTLPSAPQPTATPAPPPPSYNNCQADPNPGAAPQFPVRIARIDKAAETVTLQNLSTAAVDLSGWRMCSITGNQQHPIGGTLAPGDSQTFAGPSGNIWNNSEQDDGALYDAQGRLISYLICRQVRCQP